MEHQIFESKNFFLNKEKYPNEWNFVVKLKQQTNGKVYYYNHNELIDLLKNFMKDHHTMNTFKRITQKTLPKYVKVLPKGWYTEDEWKTYVETNNITEKYV